MESTPVLVGRVRTYLNWMKGQPLSWLMAGQGMAAVAGLVYGKLIAIYILPSELGMYNLLYAGMMFLHALLVSPINQSFKASLSRQTVTQALVSHGGLLMCIYCLFLCALTVLSFVCGWTSLVYIIWLVAVGQGVYALGNDFLNVRGRYKTFAGIQTGYAIANLLLFILICVIGGWRSSSALWNLLAGINLFFAVLFSYRIWQATKSNWQTRKALLYSPINRQELRDIWQYALPLTTMSFWSWLINYADRYLLRYYYSDRDVGVYTMGYSLGSKLLLFATPFVTYLMGLAIRQKAVGESIEAFHMRQVKYMFFYVCISLSLCLIFYICRQSIGLMFMSAQYEQAFLIGPLVAISYLFITTISFFEIKWYVYNNTRFILWHNIFGAICNVGFNNCLIPIYGVSGAAYAMIGSTFCQLCLVMYLYANFAKE